MLKLFSNIGAVALTCLAAHQISGGTDWKTIGIGVGLCVISNLVGLAQTPPKLTAG